MLTIIVPLAFVVAGALLYFASNAKASELGRIAFFVGLFWLVYLLANVTISIGHVR